MENFILYIIKSSAGLAVLFSAYALLFAKSHDFLFKRFVLLTIILYGFTGVFFSQIFSGFITTTLNYHEGAFINISLKQPVVSGTSPQSGNISLLTVASYIYITVSVFMFLRLLFGIVNLLFKYRRYEKIRKNGVVFVKLPVAGISFSFFNMLFINEKILKENGFKNQILEHEKIHAAQLHSVDLILAELLVVLHWFNPFVYLLKKAVIENNEFFTDKKTLEISPDKQKYQTLLYNGILTGKKYFLTNNFSYSLIKKRIKMIKKTKSKVKLWLPVISFLSVFAFVTFVFANQPYETPNGVNLTTTDTITGGVQKQKQLNLSETDTVTGVQKQKRLNNSPENKVKFYQLENGIFTLVEEMPEYPGGIAKLMEYLANNIKYPEKARKNKVQGKVFVNFIVEKDGSISNIKILRGLGDGCNEEVIRVLKNMPKWEPGKHNGKPVRVSFNIPVKFTY